MTMAITNCEWSFFEIRMYNILTLLSLLIATVMYKSRLTAAFGANIDPSAMRGRSLYVAKRALALF